jgi:hypothetical protein
MSACQTKADSTWLASVADGFYDQASNWSAGIPTNTAVGYFTGNQSYVIRFPAGGFTENSVTRVGSLTSGRSLTFDTLGTWWLKSAPTLTNGWPNGWTGFQTQNGSGQHLFNLEGLATSAAATNYPIMLMSNAIFRLYSSSTGVTNVLEQGFLNIFDAGSKTNTGHVLITGSATPRNVAIFKAGSSLRANEIRLRGNSQGHLIRFEGGSHNIFKGFSICEGATGAGVTNMIQVSGGTVSVSGGSAYIGAGKLGSHGILQIDGAGVMDMRNSFYVACASTNLSGALLLRDAGRLTVSGESHLGETVKTSSTLSLTNTASLFMASSLLTGYNTFSTSVVDVAESAMLAVTGTVEVARGSGSSGAMRLRDSTTAYVGNNLWIGAYNGSSGALTLQDNAALTVKGASFYVGSNSGTGRLDVTGGTLAATNASLYFAGSLGTGLFSGGRTVFKSLEVSPSVNGQTNTLVITGGEHRLWDDASGALVGNGARTGILDMRGGQLTIPRFLRIGSGTTGSSALPCVRISGGSMIIAPNSGSENVINVSDSSDSRGRLELLGGTLLAQAVRGWTGSQLKGGTGWTEFYADGGTLAASNVSPSKNLLETFDKAELGAGGLTVDSAGADIVVRQAFADADGANGLFLKTGEGLLSATNSAHAQTVIAQGGLRLLAASAAFGRALVVTNQAGLSLSGPAVTLTVGDLTLGTPGAMVTLSLDAGDCIAVTNSGGLTLDSCGISFGGAAANGAYTLFRSASAINPALLDNLTILNPAPGKDYTFAVVQDGDDWTIRLTVSDYAATEAVWNGSQSTDWNTAANWSPEALPTFGTHAFFTGDGQQKTVHLSSASDCTYLNFASADPYLLQGAQLSLAAGGVSNELGAHTLAMPLALAGSFAVETANAATTTFSGALSATFATLVTKSGSGTLTVAGDNSAFNGLWQTSGGRLNAASPTALGGANSATNAITIGAGTFTYSGEPAALSKGLTLSSGGISNAAILETRSDLTVNGAFSMAPSLLCKTGAGAFSLIVGSGTTKLSVGSGSGGVNINPAGNIILPDSGDAPAFPTGLGGFNVLEGTFRVKGNGAGVSTVSQQHFGVIGGQFSACLADPTLELDAVRMNQGGAGLHLLLGNQMSAGSPARAPTLRLVNGALLALDYLRMGVNPATTFSPTLIMSNATLAVSWQLSIGADNNTAPVLRLRQGSSAISTGNNQWGGGIAISRNVDILVAENSVLGQTGTGGNNFFRFSDAYSSGTMRFTSGGTMRFARFLGLNTATTAGLNVYFDGGVMEPTASGFSYSTAADKQSFILEEGGLTAKVSGSVRHALHFPLTGTGALTKTGTGELIFGEGVAYTAAGATNSAGLPTATTGLPTGNYTGGTAVQEGTLSVSNGTIRSDAVVAISAGAKLNLSASAVTLGEISGSGTVSNGVLSAGYRCHVSAVSNDCIALADMSIPAAGLAVTFDPAEGCALTNRQVLAVATRSGATDLNLSTWMARNVGEKMSATFTLVGNTVYAAVSFTGGTLMQIR